MPLNIKILLNNILKKLCKISLIILNKNRLLMVPQVQAMVQQVLSKHNIRIINLQFKPNLSSSKRKLESNRKNKNNSLNK